MSSAQDGSFFTLNQNTRFLLYGAASIGILMYQTLTASGCSIVGFIDKRAREIENRFGLPVWDMESLPHEVAQEENLVVIVAVKNVFDHAFIVHDLLNQGFHRLIYVPNPSSTQLSSGDKSIGAAYDLLSKGHIPYGDKIQETVTQPPYVFEDKAVLEETRQTVTAYIPMELIYTDYYKDGHEEWEDIPIYGLFPHIHLFRFFAGDPKANIEPYIRFCVDAAHRLGQIEVTPSWKQYTLRNRFMVYENMCANLERNFAFFIQNAPEAAYNPKGYFNLKSGKHRGAFFAARRLRYMPLKIQKQDYHDFLNLDKMRPVVDLLTDKKEMMLAAPIEHPFFYNYPCENHVFLQQLYGTIIGMVFERLYRERHNTRMTGMKILDCIPDKGYLARNLQKTGAQVDKLLHRSLEEQNDLTQTCTFLNGQLCSFVKAASPSGYDLKILDLTRQGIDAFAAIDNCPESFVIAELGKNNGVKPVLTGFFQGMPVEVIHYQK